MSPWIPTLALFSMLPFTASTDPPAHAERTAIEETIRHYFRAGDTSSSAELKRAFHPAAMMFSVDKEGALAGVSQPDWWARLDANKSPTRALARKFALVDIEGDVAVAKVVSEYPAFRFEDYMSLVKIGGTWRIVGKIFHRTEAVAPASSLSPGAEREREAIEAALRTLAQGEDASDPELLASVCESRTMTYRLLEGQLVGSPLAEWQARLAARKKNTDPGTKTTRRIPLVDFEENAAVAKIEQERDRERLIDYVSLLKIDGKWRVVGLISVRRDRAAKVAW